MRLKFKLPKPINTNNTTMVDYMQMLSDEYDEIGSGTFARVFSLDNNTVLKVGHVNADHYLQYIQYVGLESANVNLPFIHDVKIYDPCPKDPYSSPYYAVEMERLLTEEELMNVLRRRGLNRYNVNKIISDYWCERGITGFSELNPHYGSTPHNLFLIDVINILQKLINKASFDLHSGNVMYRMAARGYKFDAVITDPVV